jgi:hypothetical protein
VERRMRTGDEAVNATSLFTPSALACTPALGGGRRGSGWLGDGLSWPRPGGLGGGPIPASAVRAAGENLNMASAPRALSIPSRCCPGARGT